ncbi:oligosaccharyl transferase, STT3 subunit [Pelomyxa schiedti]|nr:oligosaccharyl transferase, STT3 subunit [Pelomyxa schiedti]
MKGGKQVDAVRKQLQEWSQAIVNFRFSAAKHAFLLKILILGLIYILAFSSRLFSVLRFESVIHEFDPYFNYRSTKYLVSNGLYNFLNWFDDTTWYPLGRIVGGTIYPGLMFTAALVHNFLHALHLPVDIRNVCVLLAPWFASNTAMVAYFLTKEVWDDKAGLLAAVFVAIVPGYTSRSVAGSFDNEGIAIFALLLTYLLWIKAVKTGSLWWSCACALAYFYMVSAWGGYVFIINLIPLYVLVMLISGRFSLRLYVAYSTVYVLGTLLSMQISFVGFQPVQSSEHMAAMGMFGILQLYAVITWVRSKMSPDHFRIFLRGLLTLAAGLFGTLFVVAWITGYISPWTGRFYALLDPTYAKSHIPIIASVSEHQPTTWASFFFDMHILAFLVPAGLYFCFKRLNDATIFILLYTLTSVYFAGVMVRLILVLAPVACIIGAIAASATLTSYMRYVKPSNRDSSVFPKEIGWGVVGAVTLLLIFYGLHCTWVTAEAYSSPSIVLAAQQQNGNRIIFDDFREGYRWLAHNTPQHARVMSWWDYGYQISAMANRTVLVDNNTWNNTHIAQVGKAFASSEENAYPIMLSLDVDYVLVIFGGLTGYASDDINKFLWMVRIAGSCDPKIKEADYETLGEYRIDDKASPAMLNSLMYTLSYYKFDQLQIEEAKPAGFDRVRNAEIGRKGISLTYLEEAFTSPHWLVRIYRVLKPGNRAWPY